ncbi:MAG TPA: glycoside hydrolase family 16 protein [Solirubrobacterales bacterium]|jgi:beta-glucanase (GH16 family)
MSIRRLRFRFALACATVAIGVLSVVLVTAPAQAGKRGHGKAAATKKKCKKKARKKCKRRASKGPSQTPSSSPAPPSTPAAQPPAPQPQSAVQVPAPDACGSRIAKRTGGYWECTFSDDFDGTSLDRSKWIPQRTDTSGYLNGPTACFVDSPDNVSVSGGALRLTAREEAAPIACGPNWTTRYTSGMVSTAMGRFSQTYGRFEIRAKVPPAEVKGLQSALWLWPVDSTRYGPYPASGEIDIAEMYSNYPDRAIPYIHYNAAGLDPNVTSHSCMITNPSAFHTYALEWTASSMKISYDGRTCLIEDWNAAAPLTGSQPFDQPFFIALTQALGIGNNEFDPATTPLPATTSVDYVHVWK